MKNTHPLKTLLITTLLIPITMLFQQCQDHLVNQPEDIIPQELSSRDKVTADLAQRLARAMEDSGVREFIKNNANQKFDGDYNFLIHEKMESSSAIASGRILTLKDILFPNYGESGRSKIESYLDSLKKYYPLLQISIPKISNNSSETWDAQTEKPLVAFIPSNLETGIIEAFDASGKKYQLSALEEPNQLVIVIGENERLIPFPKQGTTAKNARNLLVECPVMYRTKGAYYSNEYYDYYLMEDLNYCSGGGSYGGGGSGGSGGGNQTSGACDRDNKTSKDVLNKMIFNSMNAFKRINEWFDGGQELQITIFFATANGTISKVTKYASGNDSDFKDCGLFDCDPEWFGINAEILTWDKATYGSAMLYMWVEHDNGDATTYSSSFSTTFDNNGTKNTLNNQVSTTITDKDDLLGESIVEFCDNTDGDGELYNTGDISFFVKQR